MLRSTLVLLSVAAAALFGPARADEADKAAPRLTGVAAYGFELYEGRCSNCHSNQPGQSSLAPTLHGVIGRRAGGVEGFPYSEKISKLELTWTADSLGAWLNSQSLDSPILRMRHLGVTDPGDLQSLIAYLETLKN